MPNLFFLRLFLPLFRQKVPQAAERKKGCRGGLGGRRGKGKHAARVTAEKPPEHIARRIRPFARPPALVMPSPFPPLPPKKKTPADTRQGPSKVI